MKGAVRRDGVRGRFTTLRSPSPPAQIAPMDSATGMGPCRSCERRSWMPDCVRFANHPQTPFLTPFLNPFP